MDEQVARAVKACQQVRVAERALEAQQEELRRMVRRFTLGQRRQFRMRMVELDTQEATRVLRQYGRD